MFFLCFLNMITRSRQYYNFSGFNLIYFSNINLGFNYFSLRLLCDDGCFLYEFLINPQVLFIINRIMKKKDSFIYRFNSYNFKYFLIMYFQKLFLCFHRFYNPLFVFIDLWNCIIMVDFRILEYRFLTSFNLLLQIFAINE